MGEEKELVKKEEEKKELTIAEKYWIANDIMAKTETAQIIAQQLKNVVEKQGLAVPLDPKNPDKKYVMVSGWNLLGNSLNVFPYVVWTKKEENTYIARVELRRLDGSVVGAGEGEAQIDEAVRRRDGTLSKKFQTPFQARSMAQTRATGKAFRLAFSWIMEMAGYEPTPLEEMDGVYEAEIVEQPKKETFSPMDELTKKKFEIYKKIQEQGKDPVLGEFMRMKGVKRASELELEELEQILKQKIEYEYLITKLKDEYLVEKMYNKKTVAKYEVSKDLKHCTCPARTECKHIKMVKKRQEYEEFLDQEIASFEDIRLLFKDILKEKELVEIMRKFGFKEDDGKIKMNMLKKIIVDYLINKKIKEQEVKK